MRDKIRALLAKSASTSNEHEAEIFMAKARELLIKHNISIDEVSGEVDPMGHLDMLLPYTSNWYKSVTATAAEYFGCSAIFCRTQVLKKRGVGWKPAVGVTLYGREGARATAAMMIPYLWSEVIRRGNHVARGRSSSEKRRIISQIGHALAVRMHKEDDLPAATPGTALVPVDESRAALEESNPSRKMMRTGGSYTMDAAAEASRIPLGKQIEDGEEMTCLQ